MANVDKFTFENQDKILSALKDGISFRLACLFAGISPETGYSWLRKGKENPKSSYGLFADRVKLTKLRVAVGLTKYTPEQSY